jgi:hypothetical protein
MTSKLTIAEALLLLLLDDEKGTRSGGGTGADNALAGALLLDRELGVDVPEIDDEHDVKYWVRKLPGKIKPIRGYIARGLVERGVLDEERSKRLGGLFGESVRFPERDPEPERDLRAELRSVLVDGAEPDDRLTMLISLLLPLDLVRKVVERDERKAAKARAKEIADRGPVGDAVHAEIQRQVTAIVVTTVVTSAAATTTS